MVQEASFKTIWFQVQSLGPDMFSYKIGNKDAAYIYNGGIRLPLPQGQSKGRVTNTRTHTFNAC